ncbi:MAG TPA: MBL fold metallo-hydrolase [Bryobacteraceae bacterium]|nr:MBL fold metallo-hydrolase [Bryobacteraceae bacterium]
MLTKSLVWFGLLGAGALFAAPRTLQIYWIDAEGGASTLIVAPSGQSLLVDTANHTPDDRDAKRIYATAQKAGLKKIDYLLTTHFHSDHIGGMKALSTMIPIGLYMDHGETVEINRPRVAQQYKDYVELTKGKRRILHAGDKIPLKGVDVEVVVAAGEPIAHPLKGGGVAGTACDTWKDRPTEPDPDNNQSVGILVQYKKFRFLDMGDYTWNYEKKLVCPENLIGTIDLFQTSHHGLERSNSPQFVWSLKPRVAVMNNGPTKGGPVSVFDILRKSPGIEDIWQVHLAMRIPKEVNTDEKMIANVVPSSECKGNLLTASVEPDGKYTLTNERNGFSKTYTATSK